MILQPVERFLVLLNRFWLWTEQSIGGQWANGRQSIFVKYEMNKSSLLWWISHKNPAYIYTHKHPWVFWQHTDLWYFATRESRVSTVMHMWQTCSVHYVSLTLCVFTVINLTIAIEICTGIKRLCAGTFQRLICTHLTRLLINVDQVERLINLAVAGGRIIWLHSHSTGSLSKTAIKSYSKPVKALCRLRFTGQVGCYASITEFPTACPCY